MPPKQSEKNENDPKRAIILGALLVIAIIWVLFFAGGSQKPGDEPSNVAAPATAPAEMSASSQASASANVSAAATPSPATNNGAAVPVLNDTTRSAILEKLSSESHQCISKVPNVFGNANARQDQKNAFCFCMADLAVASDPRGLVARDEWVGVCHTKVFHENNASKLVRELVPEHVTDADIANIPPEKLALYEEYCKKTVATEKAKEYRVTPEVFIQLNANYIRSCIMMQAKPAMAVPQHTAE